MKSTLSRHFYKVILGCMTGLLLSVTACDRSSDTVAPSDNGQQSLMISLPDGAPGDVQDASLESPMALRPPMSDFNRMGFRIFHCLDLTKEQIGMIKTFMKNYEDCVHGVIDSLRNSERAIVDNARSQRQSIINDLRNGTIDTATARASMQALNATTRDALKNNPVRIWAQTEMQHCRETLDAAIRGILTADQQTIWDNWIKNGVDCKGRPDDNGHKPPMDSTGKPPHPPIDSTGKPPHPPMDSTGRPPFPPMDSTGRPPHPPIDSTGKPPHDGPHNGPHDGPHGHKG